MNNNAVAKTGYFFLKALILSFILVCWCCTSSIPEDGILPKDYAWAYGWWSVTENAGSDDEKSYDILFNGSTLQSNEGYIRYGYKDEGFYPVYTMPKIPFEVVDDEETKQFLELQENELGLLTFGIGGYEEYIVLNKKLKTVTRDATCVKVKEHPDSEVIAEYERKLNAIPIEGQWKTLKKVRGDMGSFVNIVEVNRSDNNILTKKGNIIELESGNKLSYDQDNDRLTILFIGIEEGESTFTYKRYDREQEIREMLIGRSFSHMTGGLFANTEYLHEYSFMSDGICIMSFYEYDTWGIKQLVNRETQRWDVVDGKVRIYDKNNPSQNYKYDDFSVGDGYIIDVVGHKYD